MHRAFFCWGGGLNLLSRCGHLDFTSFQLIVTKLRLDEIIVWCHVCAMNVSIHYCYGNREHDQDGDSVTKVHEVSLPIRVCSSFSISIQFKLTFISILHENCTNNRSKRSITNKQGEWILFTLVLPIHTDVC